MKTKKIATVSICFGTLVMLLSACGGTPPPTDAPMKEMPQVQEVPIEESDHEGNEEQQEEIEKETSNTQTMKLHMQEQEEQLERMKEELEYYKKYVEDITLTLSNEKMEELINKEWNYSLMINNIAFPKNGILEIAVTDFELVVEEQRVPFSVLPEVESVKGKIESSLTNSISIAEGDPEKFSSKEDNSETKNITTYSFKGLNQGDIIKMILSEELATKLEMSTTELEIRVK